MKTKFIMDDHGRFVIEVDGKRSNPPTHYSGIAIVEVDGKTYAGVSASYEGTLPHETVFEIKQLPAAEISQHQGHLPFEQLIKI